MPMKAIIVGGGIGGLNAALCFHHFGWDVTVLEQAASLSEIGAGVQISPNGMKIMQALGLDKDIVQAGFKPRASQFRLGQSGKVLMTSSMAEYEQKYDVPYIHIHRADLIAILKNTLEARAPGSVKTGKTVTGYGQDKDKAWAIMANDNIVTGDIIVGADGIRSQIRSQMIGSDNARFTGNVAWRATVPVSKLGRDAPLPTACVWFGQDKHAVTYLLRGGQLANFVGVVEREDWQKESWTEQGTRQEALEDFIGWHPTITRLIEEADAHYRWALFDRAPLDQWSDGRAVLLGDACHPMLPFMAQGAVQAIEDGYVLARLVSGDDNIEHALKNYFEARHDRTARVQAAARANMDIFHQKKPATKFATRGPMALANKVKPDKMTAMVDSQIDWLYGHDVTQ